MYLTINMPHCVKSTRYRVEINDDLDMESRDKKQDYFRVLSLKHKSRNITGKHVTIFVFYPSMGQGSCPSGKLQNNCR